MQRAGSLELSAQGGGGGGDSQARPRHPSQAPRGEGGAPRWSPRRRAETGLRLGPGQCSTRQPHARPSGAGAGAGATGDPAASATCLRPPRRPKMVRSAAAAATRQAPLRRRLLLANPRGGSPGQARGEAAAAGSPRPRRAKGSGNLVGLLSGRPASCAHYVRGSAARGARAARAKARKPKSSGQPGGSRHRLRALLASSGPMVPWSIKDLQA